MIADVSQKQINVSLMERDECPEAFKRKNSCKNIVFNIVIGQLIAIGLVSGGVFTKNLQDYGLNTPIL
jgi:hypothetical protein